MSLPSLGQRNPLAIPTSGLPLRSLAYNPPPHPGLLSMKDVERLILKSFAYAVMQQKDLPEDYSDNTSRQLLAH